MTPNMTNSTQYHGNMEKEHLVLELDIKNYVYVHMTLTPRYLDAKQEIIDL